MTGESISVIKIRDYLLVSMPMDPDDGTISALQQQALEAMERYNARGLILDLSRVEILDSYFARTVAETAQMVKLMGGETIIAGMQPAVAITATQLGIQLGYTRTVLTVEHALDLAGKGSAKRRRYDDR